MICNYLIMTQNHFTILFEMQRKKSSEKMKPIRLHLASTISNHPHISLISNGFVQKKPHDLKN